QPKNMAPERLQELLQYAWNAFYQDEPQNIKMYKLLKTVIQKEKADNTYHPRNRDLVRSAFGRPAGQQR
ncbi:MAG TPA: radical SAM protein, partial [Desulfobacter postgatei]|nr:radical SAM protein [Desulfobacter postgatei]